MSHLDIVIVLERRSHYGPRTHKHLFLSPAWNASLYVATAGTGVVCFYLIAALAMVIANKWVLDVTPAPLFFLLMQLPIVVALFTISNILNLLPERLTLDLNGLVGQSLHSPSASLASFCTPARSPLASLLSIKVTSPISHMNSAAVRGVAASFLGVWFFMISLRASIGIILGGSVYYTWLKHQESESARAYERMNMTDLEIGKQQGQE
ncbi:hypothetical protein B0H13DRAFT_2368725 [Mycena leptocephala]|nr:hypothetical protein B0H13DRAFT_2368725 [Mycena leptocephala]